MRVRAPERERKQKQVQEQLTLAIESLRERQESQLINKNLRNNGSCRLFGCFRFREINRKLVLFLELGLFFLEFEFRNRNGLCAFGFCLNRLGVCCKIIAEYERRCILQFIGRSLAIRIERLAGGMLKDIAADTGIA